MLHGPLRGDCGGGGGDAKSNLPYTARRPMEFRSIAKRLNLYSIIVKLTDERNGEALCWGRERGNYSDQVGGLFTHNAKAICE